MFFRGHQPSRKKKAQIWRCWLFTWPEPVSCQKCDFWNSDPRRSSIIMLCYVNNSLLSRYSSESEVVLWEEFPNHSNLTISKHHCSSVQLEIKTLFEFEHFRSSQSTFGALCCSDFRFFSMFGRPVGTSTGCNSAARGSSTKNWVCRSICASRAVHFCGFLAPKSWSHLRFALRAFQRHFSLKFIKFPPQFTCEIIQTEKIYFCWKDFEKQICTKNQVSLKSSNLQS